MNIDVHAHYVPAQSLEMAGEIGACHGLELVRIGRGLLTYNGKPFFNPLRAQYSDSEHGGSEPVAALQATRLSPKRIEQVAGANACKLLQIGI